MKRLLIAFLTIALLTPAFGASKADLDKRLMKLTTKFDAMQRKPDKRVPADMLARAKGIILLDRTRAGFIFAFQGGSGVAMVRDAAGNWGPPGFVGASEASLGFQIGGEQNFYVILLMTTNAAASLGEMRIDFGGEARGTAGNETGSKGGSFSTTEAPVVVYTDSTGLFGSAAIKGGAIGSDDDANVTYYGEAVTMRDILFEKQVTATQAAKDLARKISEHSKK